MTEPTEADLAAQKAALREAAKRDRAALSSGLGMAAPTGVLARFLSCEALAGELVPGRVASGYAAMDSELDPAPLLRHFAVAGLRLCLPVTGRRGMPLTFRAWRPGDRMSTGVWGIPVPGEAAPLLEPDLLLVPLLAFDRDGNRLGYGAGFYDMTLRALRARKRIVAIGIGFAGQFRPRVPVGPRDERLDWIVTEAGAWPVGAVAKKDSA